MVTSSLLCAGIVGSVILLKAWNNIEEISMLYAKDASEASAMNIVNHLEPHWITVEAVAHIFGDYEDLPPDARRRFLNSVLQHLVEKNKALLGAWCNFEPNTLEGDDPRYVGIPGTEHNGRFVPYWVRSSSGIKVETLVDYDKPGEGDYYLLAKNSGRTTLLDPFSYKIDGKDVLVTTIATPIRSKKGKVIGVVGVDFPLTGIQEISQEHKPYPDALTGVFSNNGVIAGHFDPSRIGKKVQEAERDMFGPYLEEYLVKLKEGKPYSFVRYLPPVGSDMVFFFSPIRVGESTTPWSFPVAVSTKTVMAPVYTMIEVAIYIGIIILVLAIIVAVVMSNSISRPIVKVTNTIKDISEGEGDLTQSIKVRSKDEVGDLARYFNKLMEVLRKPISETKVIVEHLATSSKELSAVSNDLSASSEETVNTANTVASTAEQMSVNINAMAGGAEQASVNANDVAGSAEQMSMNMNTIAAAIEEMSASISEISSNANDARKVAGDATTKSGEATSTMNRLGVAAKEIGQVTDVIKKIADKTNLLALNATIEAASAGEAGKGFAVVAGEIKDLANQSATSADDIAQRIDSIQDETNNAVEVIKDVSDIIVKINQSIEAIAGHVGQQTKASNEIASNVAQSSSGAKRVASAIGEVAKGSHDIARNASEAATGATNVSENVSSMREAARVSSEGAAQVNSSAQNLFKMAEQLRGLMSKFKV